MANELETAETEEVKAGKKKKDTRPPQVVREDVPRISIPDALTYRDAEKWCKLKADEQEAVAPFTRRYNVLPWAGAFACERLLQRSYSAVKADGVGREVQSGLGPQTIHMPGIWKVAGLGTLSVRGIGRAYNFPDFGVTIECRRMDAHKAEAFFAELETEIAKRELYARTAVQLQPDPEGNIDFSAPPAVLSIPALDQREIILSREMGEAVSAEVLGPIIHAEKLKRLGEPTRRGALLAGRPGTGKTLTARVAASLAIREGWSVFYLPDARAMEVGLRLAAANGPALLVCEDIDRQLAGERTDLTDRILNALDGLDKSAQVVLLATTNDPDSLPAPLLRAGRFDTTLLFGPPDAFAAERLLRKALGAKAPENMTEVGKMAAGLLPASIREIARRALLHNVASGGTGMFITERDLLNAAGTVKAQEARLEAAERPKDKLPKLGIVLLEGGQPADPHGSRTVEVLDTLAEELENATTPAGLLD